MKPSRFIGATSRGAPGDLHPDAGQQPSLGWWRVCLAWVCAGRSVAGFFTDSGLRQMTGVNQYDRWESSWGEACCHRFFEKRRDAARRSRDQKVNSPQRRGEAREGRRGKVLKRRVRRDAEREYRRALRTFSGLALRRRGGAEDFWRLTFVGGKLCGRGGEHSSFVEELLVQAADGFLDALGGEHPGDAEG